MFWPLPTDLLVNIILASCDCPDRARVDPVPDWDMKTDCVATGKQLGRTAVRDIRLDVNPVGSVLLSIINNQDHRISFLEPEFEVAPADGPGDRVAAREPWQTIGRLDLRM